MDRLYAYLDRLLAMIESRRFQVMVGAIVLLLLRDRLGLDPDSVKMIQQAAIAWVVAESIRPSTPPPKQDEVGSGSAFAPRG